MTYHPDFWVVAGTAAPVIALSSILVNGDQVQLMRELERATGKKAKSTPLLKWPREFYAVSALSVVAAVITALQAAALLFSLLSLAQESDSVPPKLVAGVEVGGLFMLAFTTLILVNQKNRASGGVGQARKSMPQGSKILRHPSRRPQVTAFRRATAASRGRRRR